MDRLEWQKPKRGSYPRKGRDLSITKHTTKKGTRYRLAFLETGWRRFSGNNKFRLAYAVDNNRLYFQKTEDGYSLIPCPTGGTSCYFSAQNDMLEGFLGQYFLIYDDELKLWYVSQNDRM